MAPLFCNNLKQKKKFDLPEEPDKSNLLLNWLLFPRQTGLK